MTPVETYLSKLSADQRSEFDRIRNLINTLMPSHEEVMSYGMPTFKYHGKVLLHFGAFKQHMSIFPGSGTVYEKMGEKLEPFHTSKGTLRFTKDHPLPNDILEEILQIRRADIEGDS